MARKKLITDDPKARSTRDLVLEMFADVRGLKARVEDLEKITGRLPLEGFFMFTQPTLAGKITGLETRVDALLDHLNVEVEYTQQHNARMILTPRDKEVRPQGSFFRRIFGRKAPTAYDYVKYSWKGFGYGKGT